MHIRITDKKMQPIPLLLISTPNAGLFRRARHSVLCMGCGMYPENQVQPNRTTVPFLSLPAQDGRRARPQNDFITIIHCGLHRIFSVVLMGGISAVAMGAEIHDAVRDWEAAAVARLLKKNVKLVNLADDDHAALSCGGRGEMPMW
jgi:hypothetical protein